VIINSRDTTDLIQLRERLDLAEKNIAKYESEIDRLRAGNVKPGGLVWASEKMGDVLALAKRVAEVDTTLLITGESGVGKEAIAQFIHNESPRRNGPFSQINCGAIPEHLLESELFGYEPGAFTGAPGKGKPGLIELAEKGTLFLDEIGELPLTLQVKILRVLQDKTLTRLGSVKKITVDCRIMAATNRDIRQQVKDKRFREDLYYRLSVVPIEVPPLRERPEEIAPMALKFLQEFNGIYAQEKKLSENAIGKLVRYAWPGNVRELRNLIERLVVTVDGLTIGGDMIPPEIAPTEPEIQNAHSYRDKVLSYEADLLADAMKQCGSIRKTARFLEISESTIKRKLRAARTATVDRP
jgi:transcriptional regulator with PAS, ATPase and Fis domain